MELLIAMISSIIIVLAAQATAPAAAPQTADAAKADAQGSVEASAEAEPKEADPVVCERVKEVGSLIRSKKVCLRKSQWEAQRRSDRAMIERSQVERGTIGH
ncbi:hypothetical protein [Novosphingobium sp. PY1]|uniref:hypothetical protein n=1 Tax=Novosphingobium sp. PY1 TaxID=1882221 RepID=UPI001A906C19|nr:hypothetical protein [Novosphingobium sp. PY1]GFM29930.1 uncharacterized protein PY1_contig-08-509 [Novosphingobium sp. PY1]